MKNIEYGDGTGNLTVAELKDMHEKIMNVCKGKHVPCQILRQMKQSVCERCGLFYE